MGCVLCIARYNFSIPSSISLSAMQAATYSEVSVRKNASVVSKRMTIDDHSSIYVGGLPYDVTDESLRRVFYVYGAVVAVKIINDRAVGGRCYGFVTFANPRSATQAIREMDGKTVDGRVVRVNGVRTRVGRPNFDRESPRNDFERSIDADRGKDRGRDDNYDRRRLQVGYRGGHQSRDRNWERGHDHPQDQYLDEEKFRDYDRHGDEDGTKDEHDWGRDDEQHRNNSRHRSADEDRHQQLQPIKRSRFDDHGSKESLELLHDDQDQAEDQLAVSSQKLEELRQEVSHIDELVADKQELVSRLREKYQKLEDSLISAKKLTSHRYTQLAKLHKCYVQTRDYDERLKKSEQELQFLVDSTMMELGNDGVGVGDGTLTGGRS